MSVELFLQKLCSLFQRQLGKNLVGVYLHGSLAMGCFNPEKSDVDILVVVQEKLTREQKKNIIHDLLQMEDFKLEMSILLKQEIVEFQFPTPFELHYSPMHKERYLQDDDDLYSDSVDPDLAAHLVVTYERGKCLFGSAIRDIFKPIDREYYLKSIFLDLQDAVLEIRRNPVYYTLNLCRVLFYLKEGVVSSKKEGGEWGMVHVPNRFKELIRNSVALYVNPSIDICCDPASLTEFAEYMIGEIHMETDLVK